MYIFLEWSGPVSQAVHRKQVAATCADNTSIQAQAFIQSSPSNSQCHASSLSKLTGIVIESKSNQDGFPLHKLA